MTARVDAYFSEAPKWRPEMEALRALVRATPLLETLKWNKPCYTLDGANVAAIAALKDHCWLMLFKGALLQNPDGILQKAGENSQSMRVVPVTSLAQVKSLAPRLTEILVEAIAAERAGLQVDKPLSRTLSLPEEFTARFDEDPDLRAAFEALTPGRQRGYSLFFSAAKQSKTRAARVEKCLPDIRAGKGLNDR